MFLPLLSLISFEAAFLSVFLWFAPWYQQLFTISPLAVFFFGMQSWECSPVASSHPSCQACSDLSAILPWMDSKKSSRTKALQEQICPALYFMKSLYSLYVSLLTPHPTSVLLFFFFPLPFCIVVPHRALLPQCRFLHTHVSLHLILSGHTNLWKHLLFPFQLPGSRRFCQRDLKHFPPWLEIGFAHLVFSEELAQADENKKH